MGKKTHRGEAETYLEDLWGQIINDLSTPVCFPLSIFCKRPTVGDYVEIVPTERTLRKQGEGNLLIIGKVVQIQRDGGTACKQPYLATVAGQRKFWFEESDVKLASVRSRVAR